MHREYTKKSEEQLDVLIRDIQADSGRIKLLQILGTQLEQLVNKGHPDLWGLHDALDKEELVSQEELQELRTMFALDSVSGCPCRDMSTKDIPFHIGCDSKGKIKCRRRQFN
jgi:hypothetical protein